MACEPLGAEQIVPTPEHGVDAVCMTPTLARWRSLSFAAMLC